MPNWRKRKAIKKAQREMGKEIAAGYEENKNNAKIKSTYDAANNENSVVENARISTARGTSAKMKEKIGEAVKDSNFDPEGGSGKLVESKVIETPDFTGSIHGIEYEPAKQTPDNTVSNSDKKVDFQYAGTYDRKGRPVESKSAKSAFSSQMTSGKLTGQTYGTKKFQGVNKRASSFTADPKEKKKDTQKKKR